MSRTGYEIVLNEVFSLGGSCALSAPSLLRMLPVSVLVAGGGELAVSWL